MESIAARPGFAVSFRRHGGLLPVRADASETRGLRAGRLTEAICAGRENCIPPFPFQVEAGSNAAAAFPNKGRGTARAPAPRSPQTLFRLGSRREFPPPATVQGKAAPIKTGLWVQAFVHLHEQTTAASGDVGGPG